jgi:SAM-dependent methyltransferase
MKNAALYDDPKLYDLIVPRGPCEAFYRGIAARTGGPVLELACGTGRLTLPVAADGHEVVGVDASTAMLDRAADKAAAADLDVKFVRGDIRTIELDQVFAVVIVSCNSLAHLTTNEDLAAGLANIERHLAPGGVFAFDIVNPDVRVLARSEAKRVRLDLGPNPSAAIAVEEIAAYDPIHQIRVSGLRVRDAVIGDREVAALRLRLIFRQELPLLLRAAGLQLRARYGDFSGGPLTAASLNQVCLAVRRSPPE